MNFIDLKELRAKDLIERRESDLPYPIPSKSVYKDIEEYQKVYRALLLEEFDIECDKKKDLHKDTELNFTLLDENEKHNVWLTKIPIEDDNIRPDVTGKCRIDTEDEVILTWPEGKRVYGKINRIRNGDLTITFKTPRKLYPPDYDTKSRVIYGIDFIPSTLILNRKLVALEYLKCLPDDSFIKRTIIGDIPENIDETSEFIGNLDGIPLTTTQRRIAEESATRFISVVQGPPGCGKTHTIGATMVACLQQHPNEKILICGTSNASVENLIRVIGRDAITIKKSMVWLAAESKDFESEKNLTEEQKYQMYYKILKDNSIEGKKFNKLNKKKWSGEIKNKEIIEMKKLRKKLEREIAKYSDVVLSTLDVAGKSCLDSITFDTVIIDEATQANEPSTIIPLIHGAKRWILVGDQQQLGPVNNNLEEYNYNISFFERLVNELQCPYDFLDRQWRMHPLICKFPNENFYGGRIKNAVTEEDRKLTTCVIPNNICFVDVDGIEEKHGYSYYNTKEKEEVKQIIGDMVRDGINPSDIGIISPYAQQAREIRKDIYFSGKLNISTVDSFQGSEKEYIIVSAVRTSEDTIGFLKVYNRLNVTVTRAKRGLVIVGNARALVKDRIWGSYIKLCMKTPNSFFKDHLPYSGVTLNSKKFISEAEIYDSRLGIEVKPPKAHKSGLELIGKGIEVPLYKNSYSKDITEILSTLTNTKVRVLWPDVGSDMEYLRTWVEKRVDLLNNGKNVTLSFDSESICLQFGDVFPDNFDIFKWKNNDLIPIINTENGIIVFFFNKSNDQLNFTTPCTILKPLLEHKRVTILTFDFLREIDFMNQFNIDINTDRMLDGQVIYVNNNRTEMIKTTFNKSLEAAIESLKNDDPIAETAIELAKNDSKKFPWDVNEFLIQHYDLKKTAHVSKAFLEYSANNIFFTALIIVEALKLNKIEKLITNTDIKMLEYSNQLELCPCVSLFREAEYCRNDHTSIVRGKIKENDSIPILLHKWKQLTSYNKLIKINNEEINKMLRFDDEVKEKVSRKLEKVIGFLSTEDNLKKMKITAMLSPTTPDCKKVIKISKEIINILRQKQKEEEQKNAKKETTNSQLINSIRVPTKKDKKAQKKNENKRVYITFTESEYKLFNEINEKVPTTIQGIPIIIEDLNNNIRDFEKMLRNQEAEKAKAKKEAENFVKEVEEKKIHDEMHIKSIALREKLKRERKAVAIKKVYLNSVLSAKANCDRIIAIIESKLSINENKTDAEILISSIRKPKKKDKKAMKRNNFIRFTETEQEEIQEEKIEIPKTEEEAQSILKEIYEKSLQLDKDIEKKQSVIKEMQSGVDNLEEKIKECYKELGLDYDKEVKENQMMEELRRRKMEENAKKEEMEEKARIEQRKEKARLLVERRKMKMEEERKKEKLREKRREKERKRYNTNVFAILADGLF